MVFYGFCFTFPRLLFGFSQAFSAYPQGFALALRAYTQVFATTEQFVPSSVRAESGAGTPKQRA